MVLGGRERTVPELEKLLIASGFELETALPTASPVSVLVVQPISEHPAAQTTKRPGHADPNRR
jgi:hypothetical protein